MWKIVIIDDDHQVLQGMKRVIPWDELDAEWVGEGMDGQQGLELIRQAQPDIVLTDIYMPVMNGLEMIEQLRRENYHGRIIILSGYSDFEYARHALRLNVDDYLTKPVTVKTIREVLGKVIADLEEERSKKLELEELENKLMLFEPLAAKEWLKSVVTGTTNRKLENEGEILSYYSHLKNQSHLILVIERKRLDQPKKDEKAFDWNLMRFDVNQVIREAAGQEVESFELLELHSHQAVLLLHMDLHISDGDAASIARRIGKKIIQGVAGIRQIHISIGIGTLKRDWKEISDSTEEAFYALFSKSAAPYSDHHLFEYKKMQGFHGRSGQPIRPIQFYHQLADSIRHFQEQRAVELIQEYMAQLEESTDITPSYLHFLANELWAILAYSLYDVGIILEDILPDHNFQAEIEQITHPHQLEILLIGKVKFICRNRQWKENIKHKKVVEFMIQYIHEHYAENISLTALSNQVYISRNYLSQIFRRATGESFNQYVTRVRMEKAKALILEGKYMIYEVAEMVGFRNTPYFSTLFKKYTGLNPSDLMGK